MAIITSGVHAIFSPTIRLLLIVLVIGVAAYGEYRRRFKR